MNPQQDYPASEPLQIRLDIGREYMHGWVDEWIGRWINKLTIDRQKT